MTIRRLRKRKGQELTLEELADKARVSKPYLSMIERGRRKSPSLPVLRRIARALKVPVSDLLR
jgi:XRE family transcriptional regulator of biofilm formation